MRKKKRMNEETRRKLGAVADRDIEFDVPMARYTSFRAGGKAAALCFAKTLPQLQDLMSCLKDGGIPYRIIGKGSNLLVKDTGFEGVMIGLKGDFARVEKNAHEKNLLLAGGGVTVHVLLQYCTEEGLSGLEFLAGVPGTVGGSVAMNAGAWGMDVGSVIREIRLLTVEGDVMRKDRVELNFSYRRLAIPSGSVVLTAGFNLKEEAPKTIASRMAGYLKQRKEKQPLEFPNAGSVFKNPLNDYAGRLIEAAGLKGVRIGGAMISEKHANFIVNLGKAKARDILTLAEWVRDKVYQEKGVKLEMEIQVMGEDE
jgi:UDP-N-acetylmuramate dehydrogenase